MLKTVFSEVTKYYEGIITEKVTTIEECGVVAEEEVESLSSRGKRS